MNLGELVVDLSLDYAEFSQSLEKAKKAAANAAASIEKSFDKISLTVEVDDSALFDLNKHLDLKYRHFKEVNNYFKNNPLTPTVDDGELIDLNETLRELTQNKHTVTIEQRINAKLTDSSKRDISTSVTEGVADGVEKGVSEGLNGMDEMIAKAVSDGIRSGSKSFSSSSKPSSGKGKEEGIEDVVSELKKGFGDLQKRVGDSLLGGAVKTVLKPARDFITGFSEGISNDLGKQISKGLQQTFAKQLGMDFQKMGEQAGDKMLGAFGIKVKKENKLLTAVGDGSQIAVKSLGKSVESYAVKKLNKAMADSLDSIFTGLFGSKEVENAAQQKAQTQAKKVKSKKRTAPNYAVNNAPFVAQPIPDPWGYAQIPDPWISVPEPVARQTPLNIPKVKSKKRTAPNYAVNNAPFVAQPIPDPWISVPEPVAKQTPLNIPRVAKQTPLNIPSARKQQRELEKVFVESSMTPLEIAARDSNKNFGYALNEIGKFKVKGSPVGGGNQTVKRVANEIMKIKASHQKAYQTFKNLLDSAQELGNYELVDKIYGDFTQNSITAKSKIDELLKEGEKAGLKKKALNKFSGKKAPITAAATNIKSKYFSIGRQAEKEAGDIGSNVISGLGRGLDNKAFARFGNANAYAYLLAIKKTFGIASPSKVMIEVGLNIVAGLKQGLNGNIGQITQSVIGIKDQIAKAFSGKGFDFKGIFNSLKNLDFAAIGLNLIQSFVKRFSDGKGLFGKVISAFSSIIPLIKKVFGIASPSKVMQSIGLDFGKGFEDGAVASLVLANKRIADLIAKNARNNPKLNESQKKYDLNYANSVYKENARISTEIRNGSITARQAAKDLATMTREGFSVAGFSNGIGKDAARQQLQQAKRDVNKSSIPQAPKLYSPAELTELGEAARQRKLTELGEAARQRRLTELGEAARRRRVATISSAIPQAPKLYSPAELTELGEAARRRRIARPPVQPPLTPDWVFYNQASARRPPVQPPLTPNWVFYNQASARRPPVQPPLTPNWVFYNQASARPPVGRNVEATREASQYAASRTKNLLKELFDSATLATKQASSTGDNRLGDFLKNFSITFVQDFLKKQGVVGGKGEAFKNILGAAFGGNKPAFIGTLLKGFLGASPFAPIAQRIANVVPSIFGEAIKNKGLGSVLRTSLPLLAPVVGMVASRAGGFVSDAITNNNAIKPGLINNLINSLTGVNLAKSTQKLPEMLSAVFKTFTTGGMLGGGQLPILKPLGAVSSVLNTMLFGKKMFDESTVTNSGRSRVNPGEVIRNQIATNIGSLGIAPGGGVKGLVTQIGTTLIDSLTFKNANLSPQLRGVIEKNRGIVDGVVNGAISSIFKLSIFTNRQSGILGKVIGAADAYGSGNVRGAINSGTAAVKGITQTIGLRIDTKQIKIVMTALLLGVSAFHKAFTEEGLNVGKALIKGFKEAQSNWISARNDVRRGIQKAVGAESLKDTWNDIAHQWGKGVVSISRFRELFDVMGSTVRKRMLGFMNPDDREGMQGNILSFFASLATAFAPATTFATTLIPLFAPLLPLFGAIGGAAMMVGRHIQGVAEAIKEVEPLQRRLDFLGGSKEGGKQEMAYAVGTADRLNVPVREGVQAYSQLAVAARGTKLEGDGVKELYEGISASLSALGIGGQDASLVFMAYTQILAKGKLSMEELRQQLGEKFPPAMSVFAKALGVSIPELNSLISRGAVLSEDILPKVSKVLNQDFSGAAQGAQGLTIALTRLGNIRFKVAIKLTDTLGGLFAGVVNIAASALEVFEKVMDEILKLAGSLVIGVTAVIGVGLSVMLGSPMIAKHITNASGLITAGLGKLLEALAPYYLGIVADVADGWLGAQKDLISNMTNGVSNIFAAIFGFLDTQKRLLSDAGKGMFGEMIGELDAIRSIGELIGIVFEKITTLVGGLFQSIIPSGLVEIGAMVLMFRQVQVLAQAFLGPTLMGAFKGLAQIAGNFGGMIKSAFTKNSMKDLFGGTFGAIDVASTFYPRSAQPSMGSQIKQEMGELLSGGWNKLTQSLGSAKESISKISWQGFTSGLSKAKDAVASAISPFTSLFSRDSAIRTAARANAITSISNAWQGFTTGVTRAKDAVASALTPFTALFSSNGAIRSAARADWANALAAGFGRVRTALAVIKPLLFEIGIALALFMFSRSDFSNPIQGSINKMAQSMNDALRSIDKSFASLGDGLDKTSGKIANLVSNLPSKGLELNIKYAIGLGGKSFKSDDLARLANEGSGIKGNLARFATNSSKSGLQNLNPINNLGTIASIFGYRRTDPNAKKLKEDAEEFGFTGLFTGNENSIELSKSQSLGQFKSLEGNTAALREQLTSRGLTRATVGNLMQGDILETVKQVRQVEKELYELGKKRTELGLQNTSESRNKISELDEQLFALEEKRTKLVKPLLAVDEDVKSFQKSVEDITKTIEESDNPPDVKRKLKAMLEPMQEMAKEASEIVTKNLPVKPLEDVYQNTINALKDFELAYEIFGRDLEKASLSRQELLFGSNPTQGNVQFGTRTEQINTDVSRLNALKESVEINRKSLTNLLSIPGIERTQERANEIVELRKKLQEGELGVQQLSTSIVRNRYELQQELVRQTKQVADYYRGAVREAEFVGLEFEKASRNLKNTQLQTKLKQALIGAGDNLYTQFIENIINIIQQTSTDVENAKTESQRQQLEYRNSVEDIQLQASELARTLPGEIIPFDQLVVIDFDNALKNIDSTVNTINSSVDKVENNLGVDIVDAAKKANDALQSIDRKIAEIESSSKQWTNTLTSGFNSFIDNFKSGWQGVGQAVADVTGQSTNLIATLSSGAGIVGAIATGVQAANQGQFGSGVQQGLQQLTQNPIGWLKKQVPVGIVEAVMGRTEQVKRYEDLAPHHPSVVAKGGHRDRPYGVIDGRKEELNKDNRSLVKKDFILIDRKGRQAGVPVPSPVSGYAGKTGQGWGAVNLYADQQMTKLIAQVGHMSNLMVRNGEFVKYGQTLGLQGTVGRTSRGVHVDMSATPETYRRYIKDLQDGVFEDVGNQVRQVTAQQPVTKQTPQLQTAQVGKQLNRISNWPVPQQQATKSIILTPGHRLDIKTGTGGTHQTGSLNYKGENRTIESIGTEQAVKVFESVFKQKGFNLIQPPSLPSGRGDQARRDYQTEVSKLEKAKNAYALELHFDDPKGGKPGVIPGGQYDPSGKYLNPMDVGLANKFGSFNYYWGVGGKDVRKNPKEHLGAIDKGISILELDRLNSTLTTLIEKGVKTGDFSDYEKAILPYALKAVEGLMSVQSQTTKPSQQQDQVSALPTALTDFVKQKEGFAPKAKWDYAQYSVGYGTKAKSANESITRGEADARLNIELEKAMQSVKKSVKVKLNTNQLSALTSLVYNAGSLEQFPKLLRAINSGNFKEAANQFLDINKAGGKVLPGLTNRRRQEAQMFTSRNLDSVVMQGGSIAPNQMQQAVTQGAQIRTNTAAQQFQINQANSGTSQAKLALKEVEKFLQLDKQINSQREANFNEAKRISEANQAFRERMSQLLKPNQSDREKFFGQDLPRLAMELDNRIAETEKNIAKRLLTIQARPNLDAVFEEALKETGDSNIANQIREETRISYKQVDDAYKQEIQQLPELKKQRDNIINTAVGNFDRKEQFRLDEQALRITDTQISSLQKQLDLAKQLEQSNPLDPIVKNIPEIERNLANLNLQKETVSRLISLDKEFYEGGGNLSRELYEKLKNDILKANEAQQEINRSTFDYNKLIKELDYQSKQLAKTQLLMSSQMKSLQLENESFAINNRNGLVNIIGLTNDLTIKVNELTNAYKQQDIETRNLSNGLTEQERLAKRLRDFKNYQAEERNAKEKTGFDIKLAELVTNPRARLDQSAQVFDLLNQNKFDLRSANIESLKGGMANEFYTNRLTRDLETEKALEQARRSREELAIKINEHNFNFPENAFNSDQIKEMNAALDELNQKKLDDITKSAQTFEMALKKVFQEGLINGLTSGFTELINGTKGFGEVLNDLATNILNGVLNLALNSLFKSAFGGGGLFGGIFGFNKGGKVPNYAEGGVIGAIGDALQRERQASGVKPVLAALTPGERVLTVQQNKRFEELQMEEVLNYSQGGVVGSVPKISVSAPSQNSSINISVPVNVQGGQNDASVNVPQLQNAVRSAVLTEIQKQQRPGGALNR